MNIFALVRVRVISRFMTSRVCCMELSRLALAALAQHKAKLSCYDVSQFSPSSIMASISAAVSNLIQSLVAIGASLVNSVMAVVQAVFALAGELLSGVLQLLQAFVAYGTDLFGSVLGFVAGEYIIP